MSTRSIDDMKRLRSTLAKLYPTEADQRRFAADAGLRSELISFERNAINTWFNVLKDAEARKLVDAVIATALVDFPDDEALKAAAAGAPLPVLEGPEPTSWHGPSGTSGLEKIIGSVSTLVPITYLERGLQRAKSVLRIKLADGSSGTGFLTSSNIVVTNHHVLRDADSARDAVAQFNYQQTIDGLSAPMQEFKFLPDNVFITSEADDWTAVAVDGNPQQFWGAIELVAAPVVVGDHVNIIQHPGGGPKQISLSASVVVYVGEGRVQYLTDTLPGSSGSPVFNSNWELVALHHSGGWLAEPKAAAKTTYYRNEGIAIDRIAHVLSDLKRR